MDRLTRIWLVAPGGGADPGDLLPAGLAPALTLDASGAPAPLPGPALAAWLCELAAAHAGRELVVVGEVELVQAAVATALGIASGAVAASSATLDWPVDGGPPQLIGIDLDWLPPFLPAGRARFPGGPGTAGSARG